MENVELLDVQRTHLNSAVINNCIKKQLFILFSFIFTSSFVLASESGSAWLAGELHATAPIFVKTPHERLGLRLKFNSETMVINTHEE